MERRRKRKRRKSKLMQKVERSRQNKPGAFSVGDLQKEM